MVGGEPGCVWLLGVGHEWDREGATCLASDAEAAWRVMGEE